jgi:hypothetical protein
MRPANRDALMLRLQSPDCRFGSGLPGASLQALKEMVDAVPSPARAGLLGGNVRQAFGF